MATAEAQAQAPAGDTSDISPSTINRVLTAGLTNGASDIHMKVGEPPLYRVDGALKELKFRDLTPDDTRAIANVLIKDAAKDTLSLDDLEEYDTSYVIPEKGQFRVNIFRQLGHLAIILRVIPFEIPSFEELKLPPIVAKTAEHKSGLVLLAGPTGVGKSTTIAAMLHHINKNRKCHVLTIEDPIEFLHKNDKATFTQREIGTDTSTFGKALRAALRQDPDVLFVGEMRDRETIDVVLQAAETGHLVFSTIHTPDTISSIRRIVGVFASEEQPMVCVRLAECLRAVFSQRLLPLKEGRGRVVALESLVNSMSVQECIKSPDRLGEIYSHMQKSDDLGMRTFDQHLTALYQAGKISMGVAKQNASRPSDFERNLQFE